MLAFLALFSLAFSATPADVAEVKAYVTGAKLCRGMPLRFLGDKMYTYTVETTTAAVNGVDVDELRISFTVPICSFGGGMVRPPAGWPMSGTVEDLRWDGVIEAGEIDEPPTSVSSLDYSDDSTGHIIGPSNKAMWQGIYDNAVTSIVTMCRPTP